MKKIISIILAISIVISCLTIAFAAEVNESDLSFAVASDLHVMPPEEELEKTNDDPIFWYANRRAAMENESGFILDAFLKQCAEDENVQFVLIPGDITDGGKFRTEEHEYAVEKFRKFENETGKQIYVTVGNHDICNDEEVSEYTNIKEFKEFYADFGYDKALTIREDDCSYTANLGEKYRLISLDSCDPKRSTGDGMTDEKIEWVRIQAEKAKADGRYPILMMHHNLLDHMPMQTVLSKDFIVKNHLSTAEKFANWGIKLVFTGHEHCSDATSYTSTKGNKIYDFANTSLSMYPITYRVFNLTDNEIKYTSKEVEKIDTSVLNSVTRGYTSEMLEAMNNDLNEYAKGFLKAGVRYRLELSLSSEKLGIPEDAIYYDIVMKIVGRLVDILAMPLYGENSLKELAKKYNLEIPETSYENGWDLAMELVAMHYEGNEAFALDSNEVTILLRTVAVILRDEFSLIGDELFLNAAEDILKSIGLAEAGESLKEIVKEPLGKISAIEYLLLAIASPILYTFAFDDDGVDDNNGVLEGYGTVNDESNSANIKENLSMIFETIILHIKLMVKYISKIFANIA